MDINTQQQNEELTFSHLVYISRLRRRLSKQKLSVLCEAVNMINI